MKSLRTATNATYIKGGGVAVDLFPPRARCALCILSDLHLPQFVRERVRQRETPGGRNWGHDDEEQKDAPERGTRC